MFIFIGTANKSYSQSITTFTATKVNVSDSLISGGVISAQGVTTNDTLHCLNHVVADQNLEVLGNINLSGNLNAPLTSTASIGKLIANGNAIFNSTLTISAFASSGNAQIFADSQGNLFKAPTPPANYFCFPNAPA